MEKGWVALVSGGNRGIGLEVSRQLAERGITVVMGARDAEQGREAAAGLPDGVVVHQLDVADPESVERLARSVEEEFGRLEGLHVAIVGDVLHSRVARSLIQALGLVGARVTLVAPPTLLPRGVEAMGCETSTEIEAIGAADVVYVLRMQRERMLEGANYVPSLREYTERWGVTPERMRPGQKIMHPGPMNRGVEIDPRVADAAEALIETQVRAGLVVRMAVLYDLLTTGPVGVKVAALHEVA